MREFENNGILFIEFSFEDWMNGEFAYNLDFFFNVYLRDGKETMRIIQPEDKEKIKAKQKELFEKSVEVELEKLKSNFRKTYEKTREPKDFLAAEIKAMKSILKKEELPIKPFTFENESISIEGRPFFKYQLEAIREHYYKRVVLNNLDYSMMKVPHTLHILKTDYPMKAEMYYRYWKWLKAGDFRESNAGATLLEKLRAKVERGELEPIDNIELKGDSLDKATIKGAVRKINEIFDVQSTSSFVPNPVELPKISPSQNYGKSDASSQLEQIGQVLKLLPQDERGAALQKILDENADRKVDSKATNQSNEGIEILASEHELQLHEFLISSNLIGVSWKEFENHLKPFEKLEKIQWKGTEPQILFLFDALKKYKLLRTENIYHLIEAHFVNKSGKPFKRGQLASAFYKMGGSKSRGVNLISQFVQKLKS